MKVYCVFREQWEKVAFRGFCETSLINIFKDKQIADSMANGFNGYKKEGVNYYVEEREVY